MLGRTDEAQDALASMLESGVPTKLRTFLPILRRASADGDVVLCAHLHGMLLHEGLRPGDEEYGALLRAYVRAARSELRFLVALQVRPCDGRRGDGRRAMTSRIRTAMMRRWAKGHGGGVRSEVASLAGSARDSVRAQPPVAQETPAVPWEEKGGFGPPSHLSLRGVGARRFPGSSASRADSSSDLETGPGGNHNPSAVSVCSASMSAEAMRGLSPQLTPIATPSGDASASGMINIRELRKSGLDGEPRSTIAGHGELPMKMSRLPSHGHERYRLNGQAHAASAEAASDRLAAVDDAASTSALAETETDGKPSRSAAALLAPSTAPWRGRGRRAGTGTGAGTGAGTGIGGIGR